MQKNITVVGVGKLGLGFALLLERAGYNVLGVDIFPEYVDKLNRKSVTFAEPGYNELLLNSQNFKATTDLEAGIFFSDLLFIIVQTPNGGGDRFYDHTILSNLLTRINDCSPSNKHIIIGCTVMPKYIDEIGVGLLDKCQNCTLNYNPEFVAQGDIVRGFESPDIVLFGTPEEEVLRPIIVDIYTRMTNNNPKFCFMKPLDAEIVKISLNGFITTKISYANMISDYCDSVGANKDIILNAVGSDSRIGTKYFKPGFSFGGPCFPRDTRALKLCMDKEQIMSDLLKATTDYNHWHSVFQAKQIMYSADDATIIIEDVCYKEGSKIPLIEESAKLKIAEYLVKANFHVVIRDCPDIIKEVKKEYGNIFDYETV
jgi:nucleotide sugar dehydrogenase